MRVAGGRNQAEAELIQGLLLEEGVPSVLRRSAGFDVPDFLGRAARRARAAGRPTRPSRLQSDLGPPKRAAPQPVRSS